MLENVESLARRALEAMRRELPAYTDQSEAFLADVFDQICRNYTTMLTALIEDRAPTAADLSFQRGASMRRARAGFALEDYLSAYRVAQQVLWEAIMAYSETADVDHRLVLLLAGQLMRTMDLATTHAGHAYVEFRQHSLAALATERRDLLEHLLAGSRPVTGPLAATADRYGLESGAPLLVAVGVPLASAADRHPLELASAAFARAGLQEPTALVVIRQNEIVALGRVSAHQDAEAFCRRLEQGEQGLRSEGSPLAIGVSTVATGIAELPGAYKEAAAAIRFADTEGGVAAEGKTRRVRRYDRAIGKPAARRSPAAGRVSRRERARSPASWRRRYSPFLSIRSGDP